MKSDLTARAEVTIDALPEVVWNVLTKPELISQYLFGTKTETTWKIGDPIVFSGEYDGKSYQDRGTILEFEPGSKLKYSYWSSLSGTEDRSENYSDVSFFIKPSENNATHLVVLQEKVRDEKTKTHCEEGWRQVLGNLKRVAEDAARMKAF
jgi:uncharacterized protein YndB with AHSA1/START domain